MIPNRLPFLALSFWTTFSAMLVNNCINCKVFAIFSGFLDVTVGIHYLMIDTVRRKFREFVRLFGYTRQSGFYRIVWFINFREPVGSGAFYLSLGLMFALFCNSVRCPPNIWRDDSICAKHICIRIKSSFPLKINADILCSYD